MQVFLGHNRFNKGYEIQYSLKNFRTAQLRTKDRDIPAQMLRCYSRMHEVSTKRQFHGAWATPYANSQNQTVRGAV